MTRRRQFRGLRRRTGWCRNPLRAVLGAPRTVQLAIGMFVVVALWAVVNWTYQALRKPTELLFPVSSALAKTPSETWQEYAPQFRRHATTVITPEFLAALAQIESGGNPLARTYWRWRPTWHPFELYRPASSALGMYQITDGTFDQTRRACQHESAVSDDESVGALRPCWFASLYARVVPHDAIALTSALLDRGVARTLKRQRIATATLQQKQDLAAVIHLCGAGAGEAYAQRHLRLLPGQRCGDHVVGAYLGRINEMKRQFARLAHAA